MTSLLIKNIFIGLHLIQRDILERKKRRKENVFSLFAQPVLILTAAFLHAVLRMTKKMIWVIYSKSHGKKFGMAQNTVLQDEQYAGEFFQNHVLSVIVVLKEVIGTNRNMAKNVTIKEGRIIKLDKKKIGKRLTKKFKKLFRYKKIRKRLLSKKYKIVLQTLHIEFTSYCNLRCQMCPSSMASNNIKRGFMDVDFFKSIINYITQNPQVYIEEMFLWQGGEILTHPRLKEMLYFLGEAKRKSHRFPKVCFLTNVTLLTKEKSEYVLDNNSIDEAYFSIDYGNKKDFEEMRKGAIWEDVLQKANDFIFLKNEKKKKIITGIFSIISLEDKNLVFSEDFLNLVRKVDYFHPREAHNWDGSQQDLNLGKYAISDTNPKKGLCNRIEDVLAILWDGRVVPCCQDLLGRGVIGDLNQETLLDVYNGTKRRKMIELLKNNMRDKVELCKNCAL